MTKLPLFALCIIMPAAALALSRADLSYDAKSLVPGDDMTVVKLKNGEEYSGTLIANTTASVSIKESKNGIERSHTFDKTEVESVEIEDISPALAGKLLEFHLNPEKNLSKREYENAIKLFDEYIRINPTGPMIGDIKKRRADFAAELTSFQQGLVKVGGTVLSQVSSKMQEYESALRSTKELKAKYANIGEPSFSGDAEDKKAYDSAFAKRKELVRQLPQLVKQGVDAHLSRKEFRAASQETTDFVKLWLGTVMVEEATGPANAIPAMDPDFLSSLQKKIMKAYLEAGQGTGFLPTGYFLPKDMVFIPGGLFLMGNAKGGTKDPDFPLHLVYVDPYMIDRYEVSNKEYNRFLEHVKRSGDSSMEHPDSPPMKDHTPACARFPSLNGDSQPVIGIDWFDAYAYAKWAGKRLPTEAEWEKAARGMRMFIYPWGPDAPASKVISSVGGRICIGNKLDQQCPLPAPKKSIGASIGLSDVPVAPKWSLPEVTWAADQGYPKEALEKQAEGLFKPDPIPVSPYKIFHMAGNAAEWVNDYYDPAYFKSGEMWNPKGPQSGGDHVFKGGYFNSSDDQLVCSWRSKPSDFNPNIRKGMTSDGGMPMIGFRCAKSFDENDKMPTAETDKM